MAMVLKFKAFGTVIASDLDLKLPQTSEPAKITFQEKTKISCPEMAETKIFRYGTQAFFGEHQGKYYLHWANIVSFEIVPNQCIYYSVSDKVEALGLIRIFLLSEALGLVLFGEKRFFLHGSAVKIKDFAHVFIGQPGAGKSTTIAAFSNQNFEVLSDDLVMIEFNENNEPEVVPAYPEIKIWEDAVENIGWKATMLDPAWEGKKKYILKNENCNFYEKNIKLNKITILESHDFTGNQQVPALMFPIELLKYFPLPDQLLVDKYIKNHFEMSVNLAKFVELEQMARPKNFDALKTYINNFK